MRGVTERERERERDEQDGGEEVLMFLKTNYR